MATEQDRWLAHVGRRSRGGLRLFCFPYAGGSAFAYRGWEKLLPRDVELYPVELPGRGRRLREAPRRCIGELARDAVAALAPLLDGPFGFFGYSMGAYLAFEAAREARRRLGREPEVLFVAAGGAPDRAGRGAGLGDRIRESSDAELTQELRRLGGTPEPVLASPEMMRLILPIVRADFEAIASYRFDRQPPLECPIVAFGGDDDPVVGPGALRGWRSHTASRFALEVVTGRHFFMHTATEELLAAVSHHLRDVARGTGAAAVPVAEPAEEAMGRW